MDNEPAFPRDHAANGHNGMSLRDYFAARAMAAILSTLHQGLRGEDLGALAKDSYAISDAMLKERAK